MSPLDWFKKEKPLLGLLGSGGGLSQGGAIGFEASGGTKHTTPTHYIHTFPASGTFTIKNQDKLDSPITFDLVLVGGGGGGGQDRYPDHRGAGGGGGGRLYEIPGVTLADGDHTVTVGALGQGSGRYPPANLTSPYGGMGGTTQFVVSPTSTYSAGGGGGGGNNNGTPDPINKINSKGQSANNHS